MADELTKIFSQVIQTFVAIKAQEKELFLAEWAHEKAFSKRTCERFPIQHLYLPDASMFQKSL